MLMIIVYILNSVCNYFLLVVLLSLGSVQDTRFYVGCALAIVMGLTLRITIEWQNNTITWKRSIIQLLMSLCLCYISAQIWKDTKMTIKLEYYLFFCSLFSVFIVSVLEKAFKLGLSGYVRILLRRVLADDPKIQKEDEI